MGNLYENFKKAIDSPEGQAAIARWVEKQKIKQTRVERVGTYLETCDFDKLIQRLVNEHNEDYKDKCYKKGYEPYPNNKFSLLFDYISENYSHVHNEKIPQDFLGSSYFYKGYWFTVYCGQGCFYRIYDSNINYVMQT
jgi:3-hydroxy-3-methylglutaryl CoA synthase